MDTLFGGVQVSKRSSQKKWDAINARRGERWGIVGRAVELEVLQILQEAKRDDSPIFDEVIRHEPNGREDSEGKDFTVVRRRDGCCQSCSFGITISHHSLKEAMILHPDVPQLHFPIGIKPETIIRAVERLLNNSPSVRLCQ